jgi:predicted nuclease of predicted toxin-antitoxin system
VKILLNMSLTPRWAQYLQPSGFEVLHWSQIGPPDAPDEEIMAYAAKEGLVVLTHDLGFSAILAATKGNKPSVVQIRARNITPEAVGVTIISPLRHTTVELEVGALLTINADRTRIRLLPLQLTDES